MLTAPFCKLVLGTDQQTPKLTTGILMPTEVPALRNRTIYTTHFYYGWSFDMMAYAGVPRFFLGRILADVGKDENEDWNGIMIRKGRINM